jgi:transposase
VDVHKETIPACVVTIRGGSRHKQIRRFTTMTRDLLAMADWLQQGAVTHVAMESTGVYWKPVWNILEGQFEVLLVNAEHIKQVPGRKSEVQDCGWIADLLGRS